jgi:tRNA(Ile)-lysidine synthase
LPEDAWLRQALLHRHIRRLDPDARDVSSVDLERLANEIDSITRVSVTKSLELVRHDFELVLRHKPQIEDVDPFELEVLPGESVYIPAARATLHLRHAPSHVRGAQRFVLPAGSEARFVVRNRRSGDRFQPLGMTADKKLKDFLIDRKIAAELRERIPLLVWNDTIVWVAGVEIAEPFKVTDPGAACYEVWVERDDHDDLHG